MRIKAIGLILALLVSGPLLPAASLAVGGADLAVTKTASPETAMVGKRLVYTVSIMNSGPDSATGVTLTDTFQVNGGVEPGDPRNYRFRSARPSQGDCDRTDAEGTITCRLGELGSGTTATVKIVVVPLEPGLITNTANVWADNETDFTNNKASIITDIQD